MNKTRRDDPLFRLQKFVFSILGRIKIYSYPAFIIYEPVSYKLKGRHFDMLRRDIQPGDVILRRFDAYLDAKLIPGFWNHAGIYVGKKNEANGEVVHALGEGVLAETLFDFCKTDHAVLLRPNFSFNAEKVCQHARELIGRPYDFAFDFNSEDKFSCTELIQYLYRDYPSAIKFKRHFGRNIVVADSIRHANFKTIVEIRT